MRRKASFKTDVLDWF